MRKGNTEVKRTRRYRDLCLNLQITVGLFASAKQNVGWKTLREKITTGCHIHYSCR
jgi:hypothetical protein